MQLCVSPFFVVPLDSGLIFLFLSIFLPFTLSVFLAFFPLSLSVSLPPCRPFHFAIAKEIVNTARCRKYIIIRWRTGENKSRHVCSGGCETGASLRVWLCVCVWVTEKETESKGERAVEVIGLSLRCLIFYVWEKARAHMTEDAIRHLSRPKRRKTQHQKKNLNLLSHPNPPDQNDSRRQCGHYRVQTA